MRRRRNRPSHNSFLRRRTFFIASESARGIRGIRKDSFIHRLWRSSKQLKAFGVGENYCARGGFSSASQRCFSERSRIADKFKRRRVDNERNASAPARISREKQPATPLVQRYNAFCCGLFAPYIRHATKQSILGMAKRCEGGFTVIIFIRIQSEKHSLRNAEVLYLVEVILRLFYL